MFIVLQTTQHYFQIHFFIIIFPGSVGYACNKVSVAGTHFKYKFCLKR